LLFLHRSTVPKEQQKSLERSTVMSEAIQAKTATERATIAANLLKGAKERNEDFGGPFDDCFEMGDADEVMRILVERATDDLALRIAVRRNWKTAPRGLRDAVDQVSTACDDFRAAAIAGIATIEARGRR
jgi:hypothetical protein